MYDAYGIVLEIGNDRIRLCNDFDDASDLKKMVIKAQDIIRRTRDDAVLRHNPRFGEDDFCYSITFLDDGRPKADYFEFSGQTDNKRVTLRFDSLFEALDYACEWEYDTLAKENVDNHAHLSGKWYEENGDIHEETFWSFYDWPDSKYIYYSLDYGKNWARLWVSNISPDLYLCLVRYDHVNNAVYSELIDSDCIRLKPPDKVMDEKFWFRDDGKDGMMLKIIEREMGPLVINAKMSVREAVVTSLFKAGYDTNRMVDFMNRVLQLKTVPATVTHSIEGAKAKLQLYYDESWDNHFNRIDMSRHGNPDWRIVMRCYRAFDLHSDV